MEGVKGKYLNPKADLTFKKIFGEHPDLVMSLLNALLPLDRYWRSRPTTRRNSMHTNITGMRYTMSVAPSVAASTKVLRRAMPRANVTRHWSQPVG